MEFIKISYIPGDIVASILSEANRNYMKCFGEVNPSTDTEYDLVGPWEGVYGLSWTNSCWVLWELEIDPEASQVDDGVTGMVILHGDLSYNEALILAGMDNKNPINKLKELKGESVV